MKSMRRVSRGGGFRGVLQYNAKNRFIGGNVTSSGWANLAKEFGLVKRLRPDIEKPVWHQALRLPKGELLSDEIWMAIADRYMLLMGFSSAHPRAVFLEDDEDGQHIHIVASRIAIDGRIYLGQNENLISSKVCQQLEQDFKLRVTKGPSTDSNGKTLMPDRRKVSSNELNGAIRTQAEPPRMILQRLVERAWTGSPSLQQFVERLSSERVSVVPNIASTGMMNGFKFSLDEKVWFTGSQLGAAYKWQGLKGKIRYDKNRDTDFLLRLKNARVSGNLAGTGTSGNDKSATDGPCPSDFNTAEANARIDGGNCPLSDTNQSSIESIGTSTGTDFSSNRQTSEVIRSLENPAGKFCNVTSDCISNDGMVHVETERNEASSDLPRQHGDCETDHQQSQETVIPPWAKLQLEAFERMHRALGAPQYRITPTDRSSAGNRTIVLLPDGRQLTDKIRERGEYFWTPDDLREWIGSGKAGSKNAKRFDIYVTPIDDHHHYILIDDLRGLEAVKALRKLGYRPALVQKSSDGNYQAVIKIRRKPEFEKEQSAANCIVVALNKACGDPKISGVRRPFRLAGFRNKKPGRGGVITEINWSQCSPSVICEKCTADMDTEREKLLFEMQESRPAKRQNKSDAILLNVAAIETADSRRYAGMIRGYQVIFGAQGIVDLSAVDFRCAKALLVDGWNPERIAAAMLAGSPEIAHRHSDAAGYITRTISNALVRVESDARKRHRQQQSAQIRAPTFSR